ncbi:MAG: ATP-binding cassette domain-containing protein [Candidatus Omnitrophota bacterium]
MALLELKKISKSFDLNEGFWKGSLRSIFALKDIDLSVEEFQTLGIVGESGSGKTTLAKIMLRLIVPTSGEVYFDPGLLPYFRRDAQIIFQNPYNSLNPKMKIIEAVAEPMLIHRIAARREIPGRVAELLKTCGLEEDSLNRYPHEFSGGQRQRIAIARALASRPKFLILDEPVSSLDLTIQAKLTDLFLELKDRFKLTYVFISHNLALIKKTCDMVAVLRGGLLVEKGEARQVLQDPRHPYTRELVEAAREA